MAIYYISSGHKDGLGGNMRHLIKAHIYAKDNGYEFINWIVNASIIYDDKIDFTNIHVIDSLLNFGSLRDRCKQQQIMDFFDKIEKINELIGLGNIDQFVDGEDPCEDGYELYESTSSRLDRSTHRSSSSSYSSSSVCLWVCI